MTKMQIVLIVVAIIIALIGTAVGLTSYLTYKPKKAADDFFALIQKGEISGAYQSTSDQFKNVVTEAQFNTLLQNHSIANNFDGISWNSVSVNPNRADLKGALKMKENKTVLIEALLVKENDQWKIMNVAIQGENSVSKTLPSDADLVKLANDTMMSFASAINTNDFSILYRSAAKMWQNQTTVEDMKDHFKVFIDNDVDLSVLQGVDPVFSEKPSFDSGGVLNLKGYYLYPGSQIIFNFEYIYEYPDWKLSGIGVWTK